VIELRCLLCGETYNAASEDEEHVVTERGEYCGGAGEVMGKWESGTK
jgi:hypothetical protein